MFTDNGGDATLGAQELKAIADAESSPLSEPSSYTSSDIDSGLANLHLQDDSSLLRHSYLSCLSERQRCIRLQRHSERGLDPVRETNIFHPHRCT